MELNSYVITSGNACRLNHIKYLAWLLETNYQHFSLMTYNITTDTLFSLLVTNQSLLAISCSSVIIAHGNIEAQKSIPDYLSYSYMDLYFREHR